MEDSNYRTGDINISGGKGSTVTLSGGNGGSNGSNGGNFEIHAGNAIVGSKEIPLKSLVDALGEIIEVTTPPTAAKDSVLHQLKEFGKTVTIGVGSTIITGILRNHGINI